MYDADEVSDWVVRKGLQAKFEGVILKDVFTDKYMMAQAPRIMWTMRHSCTN